MVDEIVFTWKTFEDLLEAVAYGTHPYVREGDPSEGDITRVPTTRMMTMAVGPWGPDEEEPDRYSQPFQRMEFAFVDGDGAPLKFPLRLKSSTSFDDAVLDGRSFLELFGHEPDHQRLRAITDALGDEEPRSP